MLSCSFLFFVGPHIHLPVFVFYCIYFLYGMCGSLGLVTFIASEHFGTNIRATATIGIVNLMRGSVIPMIFAFNALKPMLGIPYAAIIVGAGVYALAFMGLAGLRETYGVNLDYVERLELRHQKS